MYRNIAYSHKNSEITLWTWDTDGNRITEVIPFSPYIFLEQKEGASATSIYNTPLVKREFESEFHRKKFVNDSGIKRIFYNLPPEQQFLIDKYQHITDWMSFTRHPLRTYYIDIETYSHDEFALASQAKYPINLITIYDTLDETYHSWGLSKDFHTKETNVKYTKCFDEQDLLKSFLRHWRKNFPDILSGWNSDGYDIPYIVNRLNLLFGEDYASRLSPKDHIWSVDKLDRFNNPITEWNIQGISCIDYLKAYKKFSRNERESYTLDYICNYELGYGKLEHDGLSIAQLADLDWNRFVDYNIRDVMLIKELEKQLHYLELCRIIGYKGLTKFEKALGTTSVVAGAFALEARKRDKIIPTFTSIKGHRPPGGLVRVPEKGFKESIVTFDAASLYPNTIISLNISPETKIGSCIFSGDDVTINTVKGKEFKLKKDVFDKWMEEKHVCRSCHNTLFSQSERGIIPSIIDNIYADRKSNKSMMLKLQKKIQKVDVDTLEHKELKRKIEELDVLQYTLKILMNSIYGTFGNEHSILYDLDLTSSITLTGQELNRQAAIAVGNYLRKYYNVFTDPVIGGDTDSIFITIKDVLSELDVNLLDTERNITPEAMKVIDGLGGEDSPKTGAITKHLNKWAKDELNSLDPRFEFKREKICDNVLFLESKKRYITHNLDIEGIPIPAGDKREWSYTGIEVKSATIAEECKVIIKDIIENMVMIQNEETTNQKIVDAYAKFCKLLPEILANRKSIRDLNKYAKRANGFVIGSGTPQNSKAALQYNALIDHLNLSKKYEKIRSGDKIKILYVTKNSYGMDYIAFKDALPLEFGLSPDYVNIYLKSIHPIFERLFEAVGWSITNPTKNYKCNILKIFE